MPRYVIVRTFTVDADEMPGLGRRSKEIAQEQFRQIACVPSATAIAVGDTVQFTNSDKVAHQLSFEKTTPVSCTPTPLLLQPAQSGSCIFRSGGTFSYFDPNVKGSKFHGTITVTGSVAGGGSLTLAVKPQIVVFGGNATTSGALSNHKAGENAEIFAQPCDQPSATKLATVTTITGGPYSAQVQPLKNTIYAVKVKNSTSNAVSVKIRPRLGKVAPHRYSLRVFASQSFAGKSVSFQRYSAALRPWGGPAVRVAREHVRRRANRDLVRHVQVKRVGCANSSVRSRALRSWLGAHRVGLLCILVKGVCSLPGVSGGGQPASQQTEPAVVLHSP